MRRLLFTGVALLALFCVAPLLRAEIQPLSSGERGKLRKILEKYFEEPDPASRDSSILRQVDKLAADLDARRAKTKKTSLAVRSFLRSRSTSATFTSEQIAKTNSAKRTEKSPRSGGRSAKLDRFVRPEARRSALALR